MVFVASNESKDFLMISMDLLKSCDLFGHTLNGSIMIMLWNADTGNTLALYRCYFETK